jgi:hypothetical protein
VIQVALINNKSKFIRVSSFSFINSNIHIATMSEVKSEPEPVVVLLESPYSGNIPLHVAYAQRAMADARSRGEIVLMPHLLWTQHHKAPHYFVSDFKPEYDISGAGREESLEQIKVLRRFCHKVVFYMDYGMSSGMKHGLDDCIENGIPYENRVIGTKEDQQNVDNREALGSTCTQKA